MADTLKPSRIKHKFDGYVSGWAFVSDKFGHLWIRKESLENMISGYDGFLINIHVYGDLDNLTADISNSAETFEVCSYDRENFVLINNIIDLERL